MMEFREFESDSSAPYAQFCLRFAEALSRGEYATASTMLTQPLRTAYSSEALSTSYREMVGLESAEPSILRVITTMTEWPDKLPGDIGWAYVAIAGHMYSEAVSCVITDDEGDYRIRSIEWGRP